MSYTHMTFCHINVTLDYAEHPDQAALAAELRERLQVITDDPRYAKIRLYVDYADEDFLSWAGSDWNAERQVNKAT